MCINAAGRPARQSACHADPEPRLRLARRRLHAGCRHAEPAHDAPGTQSVLLRQRKRLIAAQLGIAPETLSRVLRQLRERSLISGSGRVLNLLDLNGLRALAGA